MRKKIFYLAVITFILIAPIIFWIDIKWSMQITSLDIKKLRFAFTRDKFLFYASMFNFVLYMFVVYKIFNMDFETKNVAKQEVVVKKEEALNNIIPSMSTGTGIINPNDKKWKEMYSGNGMPRQNNIAESVKENTPQTQPQPQTNVDVAPSMPPQNTNVAQETVAPKNEEKNVIDMPINPEEVYTTQVERILFEMGYEGMGNLFINGVNIDFVAIAGSDTLILGKVNAKSGDIVANESSNSPDNAPYWFSNDEKYASPVWEVKKVSDEVSKMINEVLPEDNGVMVKPMVVIPTANIVNYSDFADKWKEMGVEVAKLNGASSLPEFSSVVENKTGVEVLDSYKKFVETLIKYFSQKYKRKSMKKAG
ncbi:MAG: hypothetical protein ACI4N3_04535 [Alphaproteobacteria bacterium]